MKSDLTKTRKHISRELKMSDLVKYLGQEITSGNKTRSLKTRDTNPSVKLNATDSKYGNTYKDFTTSGGKLGDPFDYYKEYNHSKLGNNKPDDILLNELLEISNKINKSPKQTAPATTPTKGNDVESRDSIKENINSEIYQFLLGQCTKAYKSKVAIKYLVGKQRKLTIDTIKHFNLHHLINSKTVKKALLKEYEKEMLEKSGLFRNGKFIFSDDMIIIPFYENEKLVYLRGRSINVKNYRSLYNNSEDISPIKKLFNNDIISTLEKNDILTIAESEFDCMVLHQLGEKSVSLSGLGSIDYERIKELSNKYNIRFFLDNDKAGEDAIFEIGKKISKPITYLKINNVENCKDITELQNTCKEPIKTNPYIYEMDYIPTLTEQMQNFDGASSFISAREISKYAAPEIEWIAEGLIRPGILLITGLPKIGKSRLGLYIANRLATGGKVFDKHEAKPSKVLYISYEEPFELLNERIEKMNFGAKQPKNLMFPVIWNSDKNNKKYPVIFFRPINDGGIEDLRKLLETQKKTKVVVLDTYEKAFMLKKEEGSNEYRLNNMRLKPLNELAMQFKCCIILIHHNNKDKSLNPIRNAHGSVSITGGADIVWSLNTVKGDLNSPDRIISQVGRIAAAADILVNYDENGNWFTKKELGVEDKLTPEQKDVYDLFVNNPTKVFKTSEVSKITSQSDANAAKKLGVLRKKGLISKFRYGKWKLAEEKLEK